MSQHALLSLQHMTPSVLRVENYNMFATAVQIPETNLGAACDVFEHSVVGVVYILAQEFLGTPIDDLKRSKNHRRLFRAS